MGSPSGWKKWVLDEEMETMRNGLGCGNASSWEMNSPPTRPTPTTATLIDFAAVEEEDMDELVKDKIGAIRPVVLDLRNRGLLMLVD